MNDFSEMDVKDVLRYKNILAAIALIFIFGFIVLNIITAHNQRMVALDKEKNKIEGYRQLVKRYRALTSDYSNLAKKYFQGNEIDFKSYVGRVANIQGLQIVSLRPSQKREKYYKINELTISLDGFYHNFVQFIRELEEENMEVRMLKMTLKNQNLAADISVQAISLK